MDGTSIFAIQTTGTIVVYALIARWYLWPRLVRWPVASALVALLWLHALRTLGLTVLVPSINDPSLPRDFAEPLAYGDLLAAALALASILALRAGLPFAMPLVWVFNVEGTLDLVNVSLQGIAKNVTQYDLGPAWFIPTFFVPALWVTHAMIFMLLLRRGAPARATS